MDGFYPTDINDRAAESAEQDQAACMCRLILLHTLCRIHIRKWLDKH